MHGQNHIKIGTNFVACVAFLIDIRSAQAAVPAVVLAACLLPALTGFPVSTTTPATQSSFFNVFPRDSRGVFCQREEVWFPIHSWP